jgi:RNA polymerase sigma-70 factor (ECF subfamily)
LLKRHIGPLFRFFANKVPVAPEDLVQQTLLACTKAAGRFRADASFRTFLLGVARRELLMYLRGHARKQAPLDALDWSVADVVDSPSTVVRAKTERELIVAGMRHLPVEIHMAMELHYWEGLSVSEVAEIAEAPVGTIKSRLRRGRMLLKEWLDKRSEFDSDLRQQAVSAVQQMTSPEDG